MKVDIECFGYNNILQDIKTNHNFNLNAATMLAHIHDNRSRQIFEAIAISILSSVNTRPRFFNLSLFLGKLVLNSYNISNFNNYLSSHIYTFLSSIYWIKLSFWTIRSYSFSIPFLHLIIFKILYSIIVFIIFRVSLRNPINSNINPRDNNVIIFSEIRTLYMLSWIFLFYTRFLFSSFFIEHPSLF